MNWFIKQKLKTSSIHGRRKEHFKEGHGVRGVALDSLGLMDAIQINDRCTCTKIQFHEKWSLEQFKKLRKLENRITQYPTIYVLLYKKRWGL